MADESGTRDRGLDTAAPSPRRPVSPAVAVGVALAVLLSAGAVWWRVSRPTLFEEEQRRPPAMDQRHTAWGFNCDSAWVDRGRIVDAVPPRDGVPALTRPEWVPAVAVGEDDPIFAPDTWVAGIVINGEARAYPEALLTAHECINDELGGEPIAVAYQGLTDSLTAFGRDSGGDEMLFGVSGLLLDSGMLLFDRHTDPHDESLWSQGLLRAVAGPAAERGETLRLIDVDRVDWKTWRREHPETTAISANTGYIYNYGPNQYRGYFKKRKLYYPPPKGSERRPWLRAMMPLVVVRAGDAERAYVIDDLRRVGGVVEDELGGATLRLTVDRRRTFNRLRVEQLEGEAVPLQRRYLFWFAWDAHYPEGDLYVAQSRGIFW